VKDADGFDLHLEREAGAPESCAPMLVAFADFTDMSGRTQTYLKVRCPGDRLFEYFQPAQEEHLSRWPEAWRRYETGKTATGTPLERLEGMTPSLIRAFNARHISTVEELAAVHEGHVASLVIGGREWRDRARRELATLQSADAAKAEADEKAALQEQLAALSEKLAALEAAATKPRKATP
jgi:hypothetical protein